MVRVETVCVPQGMETRSPQRLVGVDIAYTGDEVLV
jgi:hypothetical protein